MKISFSPPDVGELEIEQVAEALKIGDGLQRGPKTKELEKKSQKFCGVNRGCLSWFTNSMCGMALRV